MGNRHRFRLHSVADIKRMSPPSWLIPELIPVGSFVVLYGKPESGKSFLALDWAMSIGLGSEWFGSCPQKGPVVYIACEGAFGLPNRITAWQLTRQPNGKNDPKVFFVTETVPLLEATAVTHLLGDIAEHLGEEKPALIVIDTLARSIGGGGDESSAKDMGQFVAAVDQIRGKTDAAVLVVHHTGKKGKEERGSSALRAAADTMMFLSDNQKLECQKQKDATPFPSMSLKLETVELDGGQSSCVLVRGDTNEASSDQRFGANSEKLVGVLATFGEGGATSGEWKKRSGLSETSFHRIRRDLLKLGLVENPDVSVKGSNYKLTKEGQIAVTAKLLS